VTKYATACAAPRQFGERVYQSNGNNGQPGPRRLWRQGRRIRVVIVEDEVLVALDHAATIEQLGGEIVGMATSGPEAIRMSREQRPDLVLMDIRLSGEMDGIEAARQIGEAVSVVFVTGHGDPGTLSRIRSLGAEVVIKPVSITQLREAIWRACE
jgi:CheY-like chemotaxis protein